MNPGEQKKASKKDDKEDIDKDGKADVNKIGNKELMLRKVNLVITKMDPDKVRRFLLSPIYIIFCLLNPVMNQG